MVSRLKRLRRRFAAWIDPGPAPVAKEVPRQWGAAAGKLELPAAVLGPIAQEAKPTAKLDVWLPGEWPPQRSWTPGGLYL